MNDPVLVTGGAGYIGAQACKALANAYGLKYVSLRYFNAGGADPAGEIGEPTIPRPILSPWYWMQHWVNAIKLKSLVRIIQHLTAHVSATIFMYLI